MAKADAGGAYVGAGGGSSIGLGGGSSIGADEFAIVLRHLADAVDGDPQAKGARRLPRTQEAPQGWALPGALTWWPPCWRALRLLLARLDRVQQGAQDIIAAASVLLCLTTLKLLVRVVRGMVAVHHLLGCLRIMRVPDGKVDRLTSIHWALTNIIVQLRGLRQEKVARRRAVREFASRLRISSPLRVRLRRHMDRVHLRPPREGEGAQRRRATELLLDLLEEMRTPALSVHPFFRSLRIKHPDLVRELCLEALLPLLRGSNETVFSTAESCSRMYVIMDGTALYSCSNAQLQWQTLYAGSWASEAALWTGWVHRGDLRATSDCLFLVLGAAGFAKVISGHRSAHAFAAQYARKFVEGLNRGAQNDVVDAGPVDF